MQDSKTHNNISLFGMHNDDKMTPLFFVLEMKQSYRRNCMIMCTWFVFSILPRGYLEMDQKQKSANVYERFLCHIKIKDKIF